MNTQLVSHCLDYEQQHGVHVPHHFPGIYCMNTVETHPTAKKDEHLRAFKIGSGSGERGLARRLDNYHSFFPRGFNLWFVVLTESGLMAERLETAIHTRLRNEPGVTLPQHEAGIRTPPRCEWYGNLHINRIEQVARAVARDVCGDRHHFVDHTSKRTNYGEIFHWWRPHYEAWEREREKPTREERQEKKERLERRRENQYSRMTEPLRAKRLPAAFDQQVADSILKLKVRRTEQ